MKRCTAPEPNPAYLRKIRTILIATLLTLQPVFQAPVLRAQIFIRQESGTTVDLRSVDFIDDSLGLAVGDGGTILRTTDAGAAWIAVPSGVTASLRCVKWMSPSTALAAGYNGTILRSGDAGLTWVPSPSGVSVPLDGCDAFDSLHAVIAGYASTVLLTADAGVSWSSRQPEAGSIQYFGAAYADSQTIVVTGTYGRIVRSTDAGSSWVSQAFGTATFADADFGDPEHGIAVGSGGIALRTSDGGDSWSQFPLPTIDDIEYSSPSNVVAAGIGTYASTNGGLTWHWRHPPVRFRSVAVFGAGDYLAVGDGGVILRTVTGSVQLPAPALAYPADGAPDAPLSPEWRKEFSIGLSWRDYRPYLAEGIHVQISEDSTFGWITLSEVLEPASSPSDTQRTIIHLVPGRRYFWRMRVAVDSLEALGPPAWRYYSPWSDTRSFTPSTGLHSRTIREIQEVSADSLLLAESLTEIARDRWTLQASTLFRGTFFVTAVCAASASDLYDPFYQHQGAGSPEFFIGADTAAPVPGWRGMKFTPGWNPPPGFRFIRKGDVVVCSGMISEDPWDDMNSETSLYVSWFFVIDVQGPVPAAAPSSVGDFFRMNGQNQNTRYSTAEPLEGGVVELTNLTVHSVDDAANGTFNVTARDGLTMSTADFSRWFTLRSHRNPASTYKLPPVGSHIDTLRGAIVTTNGTLNSWTYPHYRIAPLERGDIVYGAPTGTLLTGKVFYDSTRNGVQDPDEGGIQGWKIHLGGLVGAELETSDDGTFAAAGIDSGIYSVSLDLPSGWFVSTAGPVSIDTALAIRDTIHIPPFGIYYGWNSVAGVVFGDSNENGVRDPGEAGLAGVEVVMTGVSAEATTTDPSGYYIFDRVERGGFNVGILVPKQWEQIVPFGNGGHYIDFDGFDQHVPGRDFSLRRCPPRVKVAVTVRDRGGEAARDICFGARAGASRGIWGVDPASTFIDFSEGEFEIPPQVYGLFDTRFVDPHGSPGSYGEGSWTDIRDFSSPAQVDTYRIDFQPGYFFGGNYPMRLFWRRGNVDSAYAGAVTLADTSGSVLADMKAADSLIITDTTLGLLTLIASGPLPRVTDVAGPAGVLPAEFALFQNYPNPFNPSTLIEYALPLRTRVVLKLYDILGREVVTLVNGTEGPGRYTARWEPGRAPGGVYFCRLSAGGYTRTMKMLLVK